MTFDPPGMPSEFCFQVARPTTKPNRVNENQQRNNNNHNNNEQSSCMGVISSFQIIQEAPRRNGHSKRTYNNNNSSSIDHVTQQQQQQQQQLSPPTRPRTSDFQFKYESGGTQLEEDDDLDMCPARTRPGWPTQIIPWWKPNHACDKPPYTYATLIAQAILTSKDGRLTLSEIYRWITKNYPYYVIGQKEGWQNSIRHNLSLNKKHFVKLERRPTQANPGKGNYWTLVPGTEQFYIDNLTQAGGHSRKHHDIGLTAELSMNHRRGSCYYGPTPSVISDTDALGSTALSHDNMLITRPEDYESPKKSSVAKEPVNMSPMYTTFRMNDQVDEKKRENGSLHKKRINKRRKQQKKRREPGSYDETGYDSGVDVSNQYVPHHKKKDQENKQQPSTSTSTTTFPTTTTEDIAWQPSELLDLSLDVTRPFSQLNLDNDTNAFLYVPEDNNNNTSWMQPWLTADPASDPAVAQHPMFNNAVLDHTLWNVDQHQSAWDNSLLQVTEDLFTPNVTPSTSYPTLLASRYEPTQDLTKETVKDPVCGYSTAPDMTKIEETLEKLVNVQQQQQQQQQQQGVLSTNMEQNLKLTHPQHPQPVTINLDDEEITKRYLHFEDENEGEADDETDTGDDYLTTEGYDALDDCNNLTLLYPDCNANDAPSSILDHHEFVSMYRSLL